MRHPARPSAATRLWIPRATPSGPRADQEGDPMQGHRGRLAIVDLTRRRVDYATAPDSVFRRYIGGRGLGAAILYRHGGAAEPLEPESPLCILAGPMTGTDFPLSNRLVFAFRSPQTRT